MATDQSKRSIDSGKSHDQINKRVRVENGKDSSTRMTINSYYLKEDFIHSLKEKFQLHCENEPKKTTEISSLDENKSGQCKSFICFTIQLKNLLLLTFYFCIFFFFLVSPSSEGRVAYKNIFFFKI